MVPNLRKFGIHKEEDFHNKNLSAKNITNFFEDFKNSQTFLKEFKKQNNNSRYKYRTHLTKYFNKDLLENYAEDNFFKDNIHQYFEQNHL